MIYNILIHHHQVGNVVPCALPVPNWENEGGGYKKPEQMKVRVIAEDNLKVYKNARSSPLYTGELVGGSLTNGQSWTHSDFNCVALDCYRTSVDHRTWYFLYVFYRCLCIWKWWCGWLWTCLVCQKNENERNGFGGDFLSLHCIKTLRRNSRMGLGWHFISITYRIGPTVHISSQMKLFRWIYRGRGDFVQKCNKQNSVGGFPLFLHYFKTWRRNSRIGRWG